MIAPRDPIEATRLVGDHAREDIEAPGRALGVRRRRDIGRHCQALDERHDVDAAGLQHGALGQGEFVHLQFGDTAPDGGTRAGQKARAHAVRDRAKAQVEARRLDLVRSEGVGSLNSARLRQGRYHAVGQDSLVGRRKGERHAITNSAPPRAAMEYSVAAI